MITVTYSAGTAAHILMLVHGCDETEAAAMLAVGPPTITTTTGLHTLVEGDIIQWDGVDNVSVMEGQ